MGRRELVGKITMVSGTIAAVDPLFLTAEGPMKGEDFKMKLTDADSLAAQMPDHPGVFFRPGSEISGIFPAYMVRNGNGRIKRIEIIIEEDEEEELARCIESARIIDDF